MRQFPSCWMYDHGVRRLRMIIEMLTTFHAFARGTAGASLGRTKAAGGFNAFRRTTSTAKRRVRVV